MVMVTKNGPILQLNPGAERLRDQGPESFLRPRPQLSRPHLLKAHSTFQ
jgi:hypothetical protein